MEAGAEREKKLWPVQKDIQSGSLGGDAAGL